MAAPRKIPDDLHDRFTMDGKVKVVDFYIDDTHLKNRRVYDEKLVSRMLEAAKMRESIGYYETGLWLYEALDKYPIIGDEVAVMGSVKPIYEAVVLAYDGKPTTVEYANILITDDRIDYISYPDFVGCDKQFDSMLSISTFEHDGLGRYGDPVNPDGDLEAMQVAKERLKPGGLLFLSVPMCITDYISWNVHRCYGPARTPELIRGWDIIAQFGEPNDDPRDPAQPVWVLRNA